MMIRQRIFQGKLLVYPILYFVLARTYLKIRMIDHPYDFIPYTAPFFLAFLALTAAIVLMVDLLWSYSAGYKGQNLIIGGVYWLYYAWIFLRLTGHSPFDKLLLWYFSWQALLIMVVLGAIILRLLFSKENQKNN
ncbi:hypothetical protein EII17_08220 [Clostridiales bacterium COT073_COT-073]|nr:hypothetical protein EII17_08220 [Clostridiales bacterium COT073_COT-073]